jgi:hypothetical protein
MLLRIPSKSYGLRAIKEFYMRRYITTTLFDSGLKVPVRFSMSGSGWAYAPGPGESAIPTAPTGQGNFGSIAFFKEAMPANVRNTENKGMEAYRKGLRGVEIEALEQAEKMKGVGQSNH